MFTRGISQNVEYTSRIVLHKIYKDFLNSIFQSRTGKLWICEVDRFSGHLFPIGLIWQVITMRISSGSRFSQFATFYLELVVCVYFNVFMQKWVCNVMTTCWYYTFSQKEEVGQLTVHTLFLSHYTLNTHIVPLQETINLLGPK
jgi:hypothetical protein